MTDKFRTYDEREFAGIVAAACLVLSLLFSAAAVVQAMW